MKDIPCLLSHILDTVDIVVQAKVQNKYLLGRAIEVLSIAISAIDSRPMYQRSPYNSFKQLRETTHSLQ